MPKQRAHSSSWRARRKRAVDRAPLFYLQAGRSRILAGQTANGLEYLERGLGLLALRGQQVRLSNTGMRIVEELNARGLKNEAQRITQYLEELAPGFEQPSAAQPGSAKRPALPTHCPGCGAPLRSDEVDWADDATAVCAYCGSPVHADH